MIGLLVWSLLAATTVPAAPQSAAVPPRESTGATEAAGAVGATEAAGATEASGATEARPAGGLPSPWQQPEHRLRPFKGTRLDAAGQAIGRLLWVLHTAHGRPLGVGEPGSSQVDAYFALKLDAHLAQLADEHALSAVQLDKLRTAAGVDKARLLRLAQRVDLALAENVVGSETPEVNRLLDRLATSCDGYLVDPDSLFQRVLKTQLPPRQN